METSANAAGPGAAADWLELNRANWNDRVPIHAASRFYDVPGFVAGRDTIRPHEHDYTFFQHVPTLVRQDRVWRMPEGAARIPLIYSVRASKADVTDAEPA